VSHLRQVVVVTGGTSGVGRATVRALTRRGDAVGVIARGEPGLLATRREAQGTPGQIATVSADVAHADEVEDAAARVEEELGPIDVWVNNAMATVFAEVTDISPVELERATQVTYLGSVWGTLAALRRMEPRGAGTIVQVGSALAYRGIPLQAPYCGAKHAIKGFHDSVRAELRHRDSPVRITTVTLPAINTPQFEHGRSKVPGRPRPVAPVYQPEVAARAILAAIDRPRREWWIGAPVVTALLASRMANGALDRYLAATAYAAQQDDLLPRADAQKTDTLFEPSAADPGAHGRFDEEARGTSILAAASRHRLPLAASLLVGLAAWSEDRFASRRRKGSA
jgi:NAD(P)-dependent dehydrogenase (short-subunit alcohol dehydrogenase family)